MSDPAPPNKDLELKPGPYVPPGSGHLLDTSLERGADPPDIVVYRDGNPPLGIEVTEYHPQDGAGWRPESGGIESGGAQSPRSSRSTTAPERDSD